MNSLPPSPGGLPRKESDPLLRPAPHPTGKPAGFEATSPSWRERARGGLADAIARHVAEVEELTSHLFPLDIKESSVFSPHRPRALKQGRYGVEDSVYRLSKFRRGSLVLSLSEGRYLRASDPSVFVRDHGSFDHLFESRCVVRRWVLIA